MFKIIIGRQTDRNYMKIFVSLSLFIFAPIFIVFSNTKVETVTKNKIQYKERATQNKYNQKFEVLKQYYQNKLSLIKGEDLGHMPKNDKNLLLLWQEAIDHFIEKRFKKSNKTISKILLQDNSQIKNVCGLSIINKLFLNEIDRLQEDFEYCKNINLEKNTFSQFFLEAVVRKKLDTQSDKTDRFFYENAQFFRNEKDIEAYLKLALVLNQEKKVAKFLSNLPPFAYESKNIRELLALIFYRIGRFEKVTSYLKNINTTNSNNLLASMLIKDKKWDLAFARLLVSQKISPFSESTIDRLITTSIKLKKYKKAIGELEKKKFFLNSYNNDISYKEYELLYIYLNLKNENFESSLRKLKNVERKVSKNVPDIILSMGSYLSTLSKRKSKEQVDFLLRSCNRNNILSCYFLQTILYFPRLSYFVEEFNAGKLSTNIEVNKLKSKVEFSPIKERTFINQKYIEELDSL